MDVIDGHDFKHLMFGPLRLLCKISSKSFCGEENHFDDDGSHHLVEVVSIFEQFLVPGPNIGTIAVYFELYHTHSLTKLTVHESSH